MRQRLKALINAGEMTAAGRILFCQHQNLIFARTDRLFAGLLIFQWIVGVVVACWISPRTWIGATSQIHIHIWASILLGGAIVSLPVALAIWKPGQVMTRHIIGVAQMLIGALLIHLTGGRLETHFHVFGSLALLAFYRDWKVLVSASAVVAADHMLRNFLYPQSIFGVLAPAPWRWLEHAGWVVFEDVFLIQSCCQGVQEMRAIAQRRADLESTQARIEVIVHERTSELTVRTQQQAAVASLSSMALNGGSLSELMELAAAVASEALKLEYAEVLELAPGGQKLLLKAASGLDHGKAIIEVGSDSPAAYSVRADQPVIVKDLKEETRFRLPSYLLERGFVSGLYVVIGSSDQPLGTLNLFSLESRRFPSNDVDLIQAIANILATAIQRKAADEQRTKAKDAAEAAIRAQSELLTNLCQEIRASISGIVDLAESGRASEERQSFSQVKQSGESVLNLIDSALESSKIELTDKAVLIPAGAGSRFN